MPTKNRRDTSEVSCVVKYLMFGFNVLFWLIGMTVCAIGLWAWTEKDTLNNIGRLTNIALDPAMLFILSGGVMFIIGFAGCVGALRENTCLLMFFCICVGLIFCLELVIGILGFVYKEWVKDQIETQVKNMIINYRDDEDLQNLVDWVQHDWLHCCGVHSYNDWEVNLYFNCTSWSSEACGVPFSCCKPTEDPWSYSGFGVHSYNDWEVNLYFNCTSWSSEACGVPFSCCKPTEGVFQNRLCGYEIRKVKNELERPRIIYTEGCLMAGERWFQKNLIPVASVAVGIAVLQILGICFAHNLRGDIKAQRARWRL